MISASNLPTADRRLCIFESAKQAVKAWDG